MPRLRIVSDHFRGFYTGKADGQQVLIGFHLPGLLLIRFTTEGVVSEVEDRILSAEAINEWDNPPIDPVGRQVLRPLGMTALRNWQEQIGFQEGPILVEPFRLAEPHDVVLSILFGEYEDILTNPHDYSEADRQVVRDVLRDWKEGGMFSFYWDVEYYMNGDGTIDTI